MKRRYLKPPKVRKMESAIVRRSPVPVGAGPRGWTLPQAQRAEAPRFPGKDELGGSINEYGRFIPDTARVAHYVDPQFFAMLTPESQRALQRTPLSSEWTWRDRVRAPMMGMLNLIRGQEQPFSKETTYPAGYYEPSTGKVVINPAYMEGGPYYHPETLASIAQHEALHAIDAARMAAMRARGESLTGLPGILDWPRQYWWGGPGASWLTENLPAEEKALNTQAYGPNYRAPEGFTVQLGRVGYRPWELPEEYRPAYEGVFQDWAYTSPYERMNQAYREYMQRYLGTAEPGMRRRSLLRQRKEQGGP